MLTRSPGDSNDSKYWETLENKAFPKNSLPPALDLTFWITNNGCLPPVLFLFWLLWTNSVLIIRLACLVLNWPLGGAQVCFPMRRGRGGAVRDKEEQFQFICCLVLQQLPSFALHSLVGSTFFLQWKTWLFLRHYSTMHALTFSSTSLPRFRGIAHRGRTLAHEQNSGKFLLALILWLYLHLILLLSDLSLFWFFSQSLADFWRHQARPHLPGLWHLTSIIVSYGLSVRYHSFPCLLAISLMRLLSLLSEFSIRETKFQEKVISSRR